jgi:hypothetical protein
MFFLASAKATGDADGHDIPFAVPLSGPEFFSSFWTPALARFSRRLLTRRTRSRRAASSAVGGDETALADIGMYMYAPIQMSTLRLGRT